MRAIKEARKYIERKPEDSNAKTLSRLVLALESEIDFPITELYTLDMARFKLALEILDEWRLDRYYASKSRLLDVSMQMAALGKPAASPAPAKADAPAAAAEPGASEPPSKTGKGKASKSKSKDKEK